MYTDNYAHHKLGRNVETAYKIESRDLLGLTRMSHNSQNQGVGVDDDMLTATIHQRR